MFNLELQNRIKDQELIILELKQTSAKLEKRAKGLTRVNKSLRRELGRGSSRSKLSKESSPMLGPQSQSQQSSPLKKRESSEGGKAL